MSIFDHSFLVSKYVETSRRSLSLKELSQIESASIDADPMYDYLRVVMTLKAGGTASMKLTTQSELQGIDCIGKAVDPASIVEITLNKSGSDKETYVADCQLVG